MAVAGNKTKRVSSAVKRDRGRLFASVPLIYDCNFNCYYCYIHGNDIRKSRLERDQWKKLVTFFDSHGRWNVAVANGEPFFHPDFVEFAAEIVKNQHLSVITNLSFDLKDFAAHVPPERMDRFDVSLQPAMEKKMDLFIERIRFLKQRGYPVFISYVMAPDRIEKFEEYRKLLLDDTGVRLCSIPVSMQYEGRSYPESYTDAQKKVILDNLHLLFLYSVIDKSHRHYPTNKPCNHGYNKVYIEPTGEVFRCIHDHRRPMGNFMENWLELHPRPMKCRMRTCFCGLDKAIEEFEVLHSDFHDLTDEEKSALAAKMDKLTRPVRNYDELWAGLEKKHVTEALQTLKPRLAGKKRIVIRPAGITTQLVLNSLTDEYRSRVVAILDKYPDRARHRVPGFDVFPPDKISELAPDVVLILTERFAEGFEEEYAALREKGVDVIVNPFPIYDNEGYRIF